MPERLGKYELLSTIATGGMAEIHLALAHTAPGVQRVVVIKRLLPQYAGREDFVNMFLDEARIAAALSHPNVVQMFDFGTVEEGSFIAMEYLHGEDLRRLVKARIATQNTVPIEHSVNIIANVCAGLHHAHEARDFEGTPLHIVHRDISPHNIIVTFDGATKLLDFGIARSKNRMSSTRHGVLKGKVPYMAPEQLTNSSLDRRTDTYAVGVVLFELVTGKRPYKVAKRGEFDLMMAIVRGDVHSPRSVLPDLPEPLAAIIVRAMARNPNDRFQTAAEMQVALEAYALQASIQLNASSLSNFMRETYGERIAQWRRDRAAGKPFAEYVVALELERANAPGTDDTEFDVVDGPSPQQDIKLPVGIGATRGKPSEAPGAPDSKPLSTGAALDAIPKPGVDLEHRRVAGLDVVRIAGRLTESFMGADIGRALHGKVVLDLARIDRITSFGVREWLSMMSEIRASGATVYLARVSEAVATQMSMIRSFAGTATLVSFEAPYLCDSCGTAFRHLIDCEHDADAIRAMTPPRSPCPKCSGPGALDDDPTYFSFATPHTNASLPAAVREAVQALDESRVTPLDSVEKLVTNETTRIRVRGEVDKTFRWRRVLDGTEGKVTIDFELATLRPEAITNLVNALRTLDADVASVELTACPVGLVGALGGVGEGGRTRISSVMVTGHCAGCSALRSAVVPFELLAMSAPVVPCRRCNTALASPDLDAFRVAATAPRPVEPPPGSGSTLVASAPSLEAVVTPGPQSWPSAGASWTSPTPTSSLAPPRRIAPARPPPSRALLALGMGVALSALALAVAIYVTLRRPKPSPEKKSATTAVSSAFPEWTLHPAVERKDNRITIVGRSGVMASEDEAVKRARADAVGTIARVILDEMKPSPVKAFDQKMSADLSPTLSNERATRFLRTNGAAAWPEPIDTVARRTPAGVEVFVRHNLSPSAFEPMVAAYSRSVSVSGLTLALRFPLLDLGEGDVVVIALDDKLKKSVMAGDTLLRIDDRPIADLDAAAQYAQKTKMTLTVASRGETRRVVLNH